MTGRLDSAHARVLGRTAGQASARPRCPICRLDRARGAGSAGAKAEAGRRRRSRATFQGAIAMPIVNRVADLHAEIAAWRHDLHAHPELLYEVHRTAASVAEKLSAFGCDEVVSGLGRTGVVGVIKGNRPGGAGKVIGLRADMDALPLQEANELPYKSTVPGKMHACGHDGHTAMLLGAAKYLAETRNFAGTAVVVF